MPETAHNNAYLRYRSRVSKEGCLLCRDLICLSSLTAQDGYICRVQPRPRFPRWTIMAGCLFPFRTAFYRTPQNVTLDGLQRSTTGVNPRKRSYQATAIASRILNTCRSRHSWQATSRYKMRGAAVQCQLLVRHLNSSQWSRSRDYVLR